jgi:cytochrome c oxidase assembly factor CtaG
VAWRPVVLVALTGLALAYLVGWTRLALRNPARCRTRLAARLALALAGLVAAAVALLGLHAAAHERFSAHMLQHLLLIAVAAPLLLLADPLPAVLWALPAGPRRGARALLGGGARARRIARVLTRLPVAWTLHVGVLWLWHVPAVYDAALADGLLHDVEHLAFVATAALFWWPVLEPAPRLSRPAALGARVVYLVLGAFQSAALGVTLAASPSPLYAYGALDDQARGGVLMWAGGGAVDMAAVLGLVWRALDEGVGRSLTASGEQARMRVDA